MVFAGATTFFSSVLELEVYLTGALVVLAGFYSTASAVVLAAAVVDFFLVAAVLAVPEEAFFYAGKIGRAHV